MDEEEVVDVVIPTPKLEERARLKRPDYFKIVTHKTKEEAFKRSSRQSMFDTMLTDLKSNYPLRTIGTGSEGFSLFSEEDLEGDIHILGAKGEGKSKLLELLIRHNIDHGLGCCLIDPSDNGDTAYKVLKYALQQGFEKIVLIDPHDIILSNRVPCINPLHYKAPASAVVGNIMAATRVLWGGGFADTPRINKYLPAVIAALHSGEFCFPDAECLMDRDDPEFKDPRKALMYNPKFMADHRRHHAHLVAAFKNLKEYDGYLPTINRLEPFMDPTMKLIFGSQKGMDFYKLIKEGYIILCNMDPEGIWGQGSPEQKLLGTVIISEIIYAISRLRNPQHYEGRGEWKGRYYLYIDEAGDYASPQISYILDKKRKSGLRLTLSHQRFDQFPDKDVSSAIYGGTKIKVLFNTPGRDDRDKMIRMMFGGDLTDRDVSFHLMDTPKQNCWIKNNKKTPEKVRILDLPDLDIDPKVFKAFKTKLYSSDFYRSVGEVRAETQHRFASPATPQSFRTANTKLNSLPTDDQSIEKPRPPADTGSTESRTIFDDYPSSPTILRDKGKRTSSKKVSPKTKTK
jgi:hypothetical protein